MRTSAVGGSSLNFNYKGFIGFWANKHGGEFWEKG